MDDVAGHGGLFGEEAADHGLGLVDPVDDLADAGQRLDHGAGVVLDGTDEGADVLGRPGGALRQFLHLAGQHHPRTLAIA